MLSVHFSPRLLFITNNFLNLSFPSTPSSSTGCRKSESHGSLFFFFQSLISLCEFILYANSISMQLPFCGVIIYLYFCIHLWPVYLFIADRVAPPPLPRWGILTKIDRAICVTIEVQYTLRLSFARRNFNCCKIYRGWCRILNLLLVYELLARWQLKHTRTGAHASLHTLRSVSYLWSCHNCLAATFEYCKTVR